MGEYVIGPFDMRQFLRYTSVRSSLRHPGQHCAYLAATTQLFGRSGTVGEQSRADEPEQPKRRPPLSIEGTNELFLKPCDIETGYNLFRFLSRPATKTFFPKSPE